MVAKLVIFTEQLAHNYGHTYHMDVITLKTNGVDLNSQMRERDFPTHLCSDQRPHTSLCVHGVRCIAYMFACVRVFACVSEHEYVCVCACVCVCVCVCICMYV